MASALPPPSSSASPVSLQPSSPVSLQSPFTPTPPPLTPVTPSSFEHDEVDSDLSPSLSPRTIQPEVSDHLGLVREEKIEETINSNPSIPNHTTAPTTSQTRIAMPAVHIAKPNASVSFPTAPLPLGLPLSADFTIGILVTFLTLTSAELFKCYVIAQSPLTLVWYISALVPTELW